MAQAASVRLPWGRETRAARSRLAPICWSRPVVGGLFLLEVLSEERFAGDREVASRRGAALLRDTGHPPPRAAARADRRARHDRALQPPGPPLADTATFLLGFAVAIYSTGRHAGGRPRSRGLAVVAALPLAAIEPGGRSASPIRVIAIFILGRGSPAGDPPAAGTRAGLEARRRLELERDARAREAVAEERARIARELHDVVAHAISVIVLQARGGRRMLADDPRKRAARSMRSSTPASRRWRRCAGSWGSCGRPMLIPRARRCRASRGSTNRRPAPPPGCRWTSPSKARRSSCRRASTPRHTESSRRRSRTRSSTRVRRMHR